MKQTKIIMGMPVTVEIIDKRAAPADLKEVFDYFRAVDKKFSPFKKESEVNRLNENKTKPENVSREMAEVLKLSDEFKKRTGGYFDVFNMGRLDPSGLVKGWSIQNAANILKKKGFKSFYVDAGGDIQVSGKNPHGKNWRVGIRNPFNPRQIVKVLSIKNKGVATSGNYLRGQHIYNPKKLGSEITDIVSVTVIGENILEADTLATAAFAMGKPGIIFLENQKTLAAYMINKQGVATFTSNFSEHLLK